MKVIDNIVDQGVQDSFRGLLLSKEIRWGYCHDSAYGTKDKAKTFSNQLYQELNDKNISDVIDYVATPSFGLVIYPRKTLKKHEIATLAKLTPLLSVLKKEYGYELHELFRVRFGLHLPTINPPLHNNPHIDSSSPHDVVLYYLDDTDGDTFFFDQDMNIVDRVSPKKGRAVIFNGLTYHSSSIPTNGTRVTINLNYAIPS